MEKNSMPSGGDGRKRGRKGGVGMDLCQKIQEKTLLGLEIPLSKVIQIFIQLCVLFYGIFNGLFLHGFFFFMDYFFWNF